jgi:hypothetical protein
MLKAAVADNSVENGFLGFYRFLICHYEQFGMAQFDEIPEFSFAFRSYGQLVDSLLEDNDIGYESPSLRQYLIVLGHPG